MLSLIPALSVLTKIPFIGPVIAHFTPNLRLVIEYALITVLLLVAGVTVHLYVVKQDLVKANTVLTERVAQAETINTLQEKAIVTLSKAREQDNVAIRILTSENERLDNLHTQTRKQIAQLESENEIVRSYLSTRIPAELACVLNRTCPAPDHSKDRSAPAKRASVVNLQATDR